MLCLGKSLVVILNYVQQPDPCGPEPCSPDNGPGPVPWLGKVREHHVLREHHVFPEEAGAQPKQAEAPDLPWRSEPQGIPDPPWGPGPPV